MIQGTSRETENKGGKSSRSKRSQRVRGRKQKKSKESSKVLGAMEEVYSRTW